MKPESCNQTRTHLLETACKLFAEHGYDAVSTRMIAEAANVNLGGIHYHFGSKESLYIEAFRLASDAAGSRKTEDIIREEPDLLLTPEGQAEIIRRKVFDYFKRYLLLDEDWKRRLIMREIYQHSAAHQKLVDFIFKPESDDMLRFFQRIRPDKSFVEAYVWALFLSTQGSFYLLARPALKQSHDSHFVQSTLPRELARTCTKVMIQMLDLPVPKNLDELILDENEFPSESQKPL